MIPVTNEAVDYQKFEKRKKENKMKINKSGLILNFRKRLKRGRYADEIMPMAATATERSFGSLSWV